MRRAQEDFKHLARKIVAKVMLKEERRTRDQQLEGRLEDMVKKRILRVHRQHISGCPGRNEKEAALSILYGETLAHYRSVLKSCRLGRNH